MVIGKSFKENSKLIIFIYLFLLIAFVSGIIFTSIFLDKMVTKILLIVIISFLLLAITYLPIYVYKSKKMPENIVLYNEIDETITINGYKNKHIIKISDISVITVQNIATKLLFANRIEEGKLCFYLNDGTIIKTSDITNVYEAYNKLDEIIYKDKEYDSNKKQVIDKLDGWGSKKEYPSIVSVLVALFIPFFGIFFVSNQVKFKKTKNGKATGLMGVSLVISAIWVFVIIIVFYLI